MSLTLVDQGGNKIPRFGAAGIKKVIKSPIKVTINCKFNTYAMVWCEESEVYLVRFGKGNTYELTVVYWKDDECTEEFFEASQLDKAITKFIKLCKHATP